MSERESSPERPESNRERLISAASEALGQDVVEGLVELGLDDEDLTMAVYAELVLAGIEDPEEFFREQASNSPPLLIKYEIIL